MKDVQKIDIEHHERDAVAVMQVANVRLCKILEPFPALPRFVNRRINRQLPEPIHPSPPQTVY